MKFVGVDLLFVTHANICDAFQLHAGPIISGSKNLMYHSMSIGVSATNTLVKFLKYALCFFCIYALKKDKIIVSFVDG